MRALLIEDDAGIASSIELILKNEYIRIYVTDLGEEGIDLAKIYDYDIVLLDLNLPDMPGYETSYAHPNSFGAREHRGQD